MVRRAGVRGYGALFRVFVHKRRGRRETARNGKENDFIRDYRHCRFNHIVQSDRDNENSFLVGA